MLVDVDILSIVDFDLTLPCEYSHHEDLGCTDPAKYFVVSSCSQCSDEVKLMMCPQCYLTGKTIHVECACGHIDLGAVFWTILQEI